MQKPPDLPALPLRMFFLIITLLGTGCQSDTAKKTDTSAAEVWNDTTLSEQTQQAVQAAALDYQKCLNQQIMAGLPAQADPRAVTDTILGACEMRLQPIKTAFDAEKIPEEISNRYIRQKRTQGARNVLKYVLAAQAAQAADASSKQIDNQNKTGNPAR